MRSISGGGGGGGGGGWEGGVGSGITSSSSPLDMLITESLSSVL